AAKDVTARFERTVDIRVRVVGAGTVASSTGDTCDGSGCTLTVVSGQLVDLRAKPGASSRLVGWSGACTGQGTCSILASGATTVTATFGSAFVHVKVALTGNGRVVG